VCFSVKRISIYISRYIYVYLIKLCLLTYILFFTIVFYILCTLLPFSVFAMCIIFILIISQFWAEIFNIVFQTNVSRSRIMPIMTEYFVDQEKYFYFILLWTNVTICLQGIILLAIDTMFITFFLHIYGMFKIARYKNKNMNRKINIQDIYSRFLNEIKKIYKEYMLFCKYKSNRSIYL